MRKWYWHVWRGNLIRAFVMVYYKRELTEDEIDAVNKLIDEVTYDEPFYAVPQFYNHAICERKLIERLQEIIKTPVIVWFGGVYWGRDVDDEDFNEVDSITIAKEIQHEYINKELARVVW